jgi:hypothetical protein
VPDAWPATIAAALLRRGALVHAMSAVLTVASLLGGIVLDMGGVRLVAGVVVVVGLAEFWLAARVAIDADLFAALAGNDPARFDEAMQKLGLMGDDKAGRPIEARIRGALRLLKLQTALLLLQIAALFAAMLVLR